MTNTDGGLDEFISWIINGDVDHELDDIQRAIWHRQAEIRGEQGIQAFLNASQRQMQTRDDRRERRAIETEQARAVLRPGMRCRLKGLRPQYMNGKTVTIVRINQTRAVIEMPADATLRRFSGMADVTVPLRCLEPVS